MGLRCLLLAAGVFCLWEFYGLCRDKGIETARLAGLFCLTLSLGPVPLNALLNAAGIGNLANRIAVQTQIVPLALTVYALMRLAVRPRLTVEGAAMTIAGYFYVSLLGYVMQGPSGLLLPWYFVLFLLAANKASDMAAYATGKLVGRHKMAPHLSPGKTWEGAVGGLVAGTAAGGAVLLLTPLRAEYGAVPVATLLLYAACVTMAAQAGDLVESAFKRWAGAKDSGRFLPEFGGMLDMADSFLISAPVAFLLRLWVLE